MQQTINIPEGFELVRTSETSYEIKKKINLPETWEEFCKTHRIKDGEYFISTNSSIVPCVNGNNRYRDQDQNLLPSKSDAEGILALIKLIQLRDCYNDGWKPDWRDVQSNKYAIYRSGNNVDVGTYNTKHRILSFKTSELRDMFLTNFEDLIEIAKDFI